MPPQHIAVLGGGLTGLSAAFHLLRRFPLTKLSILEKRSRLGGWILSERVHLNGASFLLESGPRTLRPNSKPLLELIHLLGLSPSLITVPTTSPAANTRFLCLPPAPGLLSLPSSLLGLLTSPLAPLLLRAILTDLFRSPNRHPAITDESVEAFLARRFGPELARVLGSALVHGIYAADARLISVRAAFGALWDIEEDGAGSVVRGIMRRMFNPQKNVGDEPYELGDVAARMEGVAVFSFRDGVQTLTDALVQRISQHPNVDIRRDTAATSFRPGPGSFEIHTTTNERLTPTHVVSALPLPALHALLPHTSLPHLTATPASSVTVVNLVFPPHPPIHPPGFGYLIPRPPSDYDPAHPGILGTVFDSCALTQQDTPAPGAAAAPRKLTVMLGGPHALGPAHTTPDVVLRHLALHLRASEPLPEPLLVRVRHHVDCIPALAVGHGERMAELRVALAGGVWGGRMEVVGAGVGGVSVGDCVEAGRGVGKTWA